LRRKVERLRTLEKDERSTIAEICGTLAIAQVTFICISNQSEITYGGAKWPISYVG